MSYPSAGGPQNWASLLEDVIAGRADAGLQRGDTSVDAALTRAVRDLDLDPPGVVTALRAATDPLFADLITVGANMATILATLRNALAAANSNPDWSNSKRVQEVTAARNTAIADLDAQQTSAIRTARKIRAQIDAVTAPAATGVSPDVLEAQIAGAWSVAQPFLGGVVTAGAVQQLMAFGIPGMAQALRRYLPAVVSAQYAGQPTQHINLYQEAAMQQLDAAEEPSMSAGAQLARQLRARLENGLGRLQSGYAQARLEAQARTTPMASLLGFEGMHGVSVPPYGAAQQAQAAGR